MSGVDKVVSCTAVAVMLFAGGAPLTGQAPVQNGQSVAIAASDFTLSTALDRVDAMLTGGTLDISTIQDDTMIGGRAFERLGQSYQGLPVFGGQVVRQMDGRSMVSVTGRLYEAVVVDVNPSIAPERAGVVAAASVGAGARVHGETTLGILPVESGYRLVYRMTVLSDWAIQDVYVDADSGEIVLSASAIRTQATIGEGNGMRGSRRKMSTNQTSATFQAVDKLRTAQAFTLAFPGTLARVNAFFRTMALFNSDVATDSDNVWTDAAVVDAHVFQGWVHDYYFARFGRRGMDDRNGEVDSIVHPLARSEANRQPDDIVFSYINNALYCCQGVLMFGDGDGRTFNSFAAGLDIVAHEWSHGVIEFTSGLLSRDEPGALNEAFADIMGAATEFYHYPVGTARDQADWLIAEDVVLVSPGYLRSLNNPSAAGYPDHYTLRRHIGTSTDQGGVHTNLTIATHAFYLAVAGGRNRESGMTVPGLGVANMDRMERVFYRAFTQLMTPNSQFSDARRATLQAASDLYGDGSNERAQVELAWNAVGVN
jgi:thermolysin